MVIKLVEPVLKITAGGFYQGVQPGRRSKRRSGLAAQALLWEYRGLERLVRSWANGVEREPDEIVIESQKYQREALPCLPKW